MLDIISALHMSTALPTDNMDSTPETDAVNSSSTSIKMCSIELQLNSSFRLQCSLSSLESDSDLSLAFERELGEEEPADCDGLPAFEIRAFSPHGRTPSPIDDVHYHDIETPKQQQQQQQRSPGRQNNPEFVALHEINAQISPPSDNADEPVSNTADGISRANSLETIFEGVFLQTPPREKLNNSTGSSLNSNSSNRNTPKRVRANLMELVAINRLQSGINKENQSPYNEQQQQQRHELT